MRLTGLSIVAFLAVIMLGSVASAAPGEGIRLSEDTTLSPFAEIIGTYDSNVFLDETDEEDDIFFDLVGGLSLLKQDEVLMANLRGWVKARRYLDFDELDDETWQENFDLVIGSRDKLQLALSQKYSEVSDYEFTQQDVGARNQEGQAVIRLIEGRTRRTTRQLQDYGVALGHARGRVEVEAGAGYGAVDFDDQEFYDWNELQADLMLAFRVSDRSLATLSGSYGMQETDNFLSDPEFIKVLVGFRTEPSAKTSIKVGVGIESYDVGESPETGENLDDEVFIFDVIGTWDATEKLDIQIFGRNEIVPTSAFEANTKQVDQGSIGAIYTFNSQWLSSLGGSYRRDDYTLPVLEVASPEETLLGVQWRLVYTTRNNFIKVEGRIRYEDFESNFQRDYDQLRASLALNMTY